MLRKKNMPPLLLHTSKNTVSIKFQTFILTAKPFGPGRPMFPAAPRFPVEPAGPGFPSSPAKL